MHEGLRPVWPTGGAELIVGNVRMGKILHHAPSLIPRKAGDGVKTNRSDAMMLAKLHRSGEFTPV